MYRYGYQPRLMGQLGPNPIYYGDGFSISFPVAWSLWTPDAEEIAGHLQSRGLAHDVVSGQIAGVVNPYLAITGRASGNWSTASSFRDAVLDAVSGLGFDIDYSAVKYEIMPRPRSTSPTPAPAPRPSTPAPSPRPQRPRSDEPSTPSEEAMYFDIAGEPPREPYTPPAPQAKGTSPLLWLGLGLLAIVAISSRD